LSTRQSVYAAESGREVVLWIVATALATGTSTLDLMVCDTSTSLIAILLASIVVGYLGPRRAWQWGLLFGAFLPLAHLLTRRGGELAGLLAFVPSFVGAYLGAFLDKMMRELRGSP
jgi:hypothetical protein